MDQNSDSASTVLDALEKLRDAFDVRHSRSLRQLSDNPNKIFEDWKRLESALTKAVDIIHSPTSGQGLKSIWLAAVCERAAKVEDALNRPGNDWPNLLFHDNDSFWWLVTNGREKGSYIIGFGRRQPRPLASLLEPAISPIAKLWLLAKRWREEYPTEPTKAPQGWPRKRDEYVVQAAGHLLQAVNTLEVPAAVTGNGVFREEIVNCIDTPSHLIWPRLVNESSGSLEELVEWLAGKTSPDGNVQPNMAIGLEDQHNRPGHSASPVDLTTATKPYPEPDLYGRDKWIYDSIDSHSFPSLSQLFSERARVEKWEIITSRNGFRKAANRYADYHGFPRKKFRQMRRSK